MSVTVVQGLKVGFSIHNFSNTTDRILRQNIAAAVRDIRKKRIPNKSISLYIKLNMCDVRKYDITYMKADGKHIVFDVACMDNDILDLLHSSGFKINYWSRPNSEDLTILSIQLDRNVM